MLDNYQGQYLVNSMKMGFALYLTDIALRPRFTGGAGMEIMLFAIQGVVISFLYNNSQQTCTEFTDADTGDTYNYCTKPETLWQNTFIAAITIYFTDFLLGIVRFDGMAQALIKFMIQGMIVNSVLSYQLYMGALAPPA